MINEERIKDDNGDLKFALLTLAYFLCQHPKHRYFDHI